MRDRLVPGPATDQAEERTAEDRAETVYDNLRRQSSFYIDSAPDVVLEVARLAAKDERSIRLRAGEGGVSIDLLETKPDRPTLALADIRAGVWRHYKGHLYAVEGYSHNASDDNRPQVSYFPMELDGASSGPRRCTRDVAEFFDLVCTMHDGMLWFSHEHDEVTIKEREAGTLDDRLHQDTSCKARFEYLGPEYHPGYRRA